MVRFHLAILIDGIPYAFGEQATPSTVSSRMVLPVIVAVQEGETRLNLEERRQEDATLDVELVDTDANDLRTLFAQTQYPQTWVSSDIAVGDTDVYVDSETGLTSPVYVGAETIAFSGTTAGALTGCTRGAFGSTASAIKGTVTDGENVYQTPPSWIGRRAQLVAITFDEAGTAETRTLSTWLVDESPQYAGDGRWRLRFGGLAQEYASRPVMLGVVEVGQLEGGSDTLTPTGSSFEIEVEDARLFRESFYPGFTHVVVRSRSINDEERTSIHELTDVDTATNTLTITAAPKFGTGYPYPFFVSARMFAVGGGPSPFGLLTWLLSTEGQGVNTWDALPGRVASTYDGPTFRCGAGFTADEVDTTAIFEVTFANHFFALLSERPVGDLIREVCLLSRCVSRVTRLGKLTITPLSERVTASVTFDGDVVLPEAPTVEVDEANVSPVVSLSVGYDPITEEHTATLNLVDIELARRYPRAPRRREIELIGVHVSDPSVRRLLAGVSDFVSPATTTAAALIDSSVRDLQRGVSGRPGRYVTLQTTFDAWSVEVGDTVLIGSGLPASFADMPDFEGGTVEGSRALVVGRRPDYDRGAITWRLLVTEAVLVICPTALIASRSGADVTLTATGTVVSGAAPARDFWVGAQVRVYDRSTLLTGSPVSELRTVNAIVSDTVLTLSSAPSFAHAAGDYLVLSPATSAAGTSASGYSLDEMAMMVEDDGTGTVSDAAAEDTPRWS